MAAQVTALPESRLEQAIDLWSLSFGGYSRSYWRSYAAEGVNRLYAAVEDGQVLSVAGIIDFETRLGDEWIPCGGLASVATHPDHRKKGLSKQVLTECLIDLRTRKIPLATLGTSIHPFYEKLGWSVTDWRHIVEISGETLSELGAGGDADRYIPHAQEEALDIVIPLHERWSERFALSMRRDRRRWLRGLTEPGFDGEFHIHPDGYILLDRAASEKENKCIVAEWAYLTDDAFRDGLALLAGKLSRAGQATARWRDANHYPFTKFQKPNSPLPTISVSPGGMSRVVDLKAFADRLAARAPDLPRRLQSVGISDPLGVTAGHNPYGIGPGELVQLVIGFSGASAPAWPAELSELSGVAGKALPFTVEMY